MRACLCSRGCVANLIAGRVSSIEFGEVAASAAPETPKRDLATVIMNAEPLGHPGRPALLHNFAIAKSYVHTSIKEN